MESKPKAEEAEPATQAHRPRLVFPVGIERHHIAKRIIELARELEQCQPASAPESSR